MPASARSVVFASPLRSRLTRGSLRRIRPASSFWRSPLAASSALIVSAASLSRSSSSSSWPSSKSRLPAPVISTTPRRLPVRELNVALP